jgi:MFS family permease
MRARPDVTAIQRRTVRLLAGTQVIGGVGVAVGISVGALLAADLAGTRASGLAGSAAVVGAAIFAIPAVRIMRYGGRRLGLAFAYIVGALGAAGIIVGVAGHSTSIFFVGMLLFGGGSTANLQARYAALDLATPDRRGSQLSVVVWATTVGAVAGPNLAPLTDRLASARGLPGYSGAFVVSAVAFLVAAATILALLRPDPLLTARSLPAAVPPDGPASAMGSAATGSWPAPGRDDVERSVADPSGAPLPPPPSGQAGGGWRQAIAAVRASRGAFLGITAVVVGHLVMVSVMSMTPLEISAYTVGHTHVLRVVGIVLSVHIAGMYALSPVVGWLTDHVGRRPVILACAIAGTAGEHTTRLSVGLALLGLGWSGTMVAGSTLLSESVAATVAPSVQGLSDVVMGLVAASAGALAGVIVDFFGYPTLTLVAAISTAPLIGLATRGGARRECAG